MSNSSIADLTLLPIHAVRDHTRKAWDTLYRPNAIPSAQDVFRHLGRGGSYQLVQKEVEALRIDAAAKRETRQQADSFWMAAASPTPSVATTPSRFGQRHKLTPPQHARLREALLTYLEDQHWTYADAERQWAVSATAVANICKQRTRDITVVLARRICHGMGADYDTVVGPAVVETPAPPPAPEPEPPPVPENQAPDEVRAVPGPYGEQVLACLREHTALLRILHADLEHLRQVLLMLLQKERTP